MYYFKYTCLLLLALMLYSFYPARKYIQKAENNVERGNLKAAIRYYLKALEKDSANPRANAGLGLVYCELLDNYTTALPYLERAYRYPIKDSTYGLFFALGKCYHHNGDYKKAIGFYDRLNGVKDLEKESNFEAEIKKRRADCEYAMLHQNDPIDNLYIVNAGKNINSEMPEYVPVLTSRNQFIFTSKRRDSRREKLNWVDSKYFESMYIADIENGRFKSPRRFTLPDKYMKSHYRRLHESVVSLSQDGKMLFTFMKGDIYEIDISAVEMQKPRKIVTTFGEQYFQNHAFLTRDGNTLYFTSDADGGYGGLDIYKCSKNKEGVWSKPVNLGEKINTVFDEDAPYISYDGSTFFFSSKGHPGYGNFDIYRCKLSDNGPVSPVNVGMPLNSPGHDIFLVEDSTGNNSYFSSGRNGGFGDMDIYKVMQLDKVNTDCPLASSPVSLLIADGQANDYTNFTSASLPTGFKILSSSWQVNNTPVTGKKDTLEYDFRQPGTYTVSNKMMLYCDTCLTPVIACHTIVNQVNEVKLVDTTLLAGNTGTDATNPSAVLPIVPLPGSNGGNTGGNITGGNNTGGGNTGGTTGEPGTAGNQPSGGTAHNVAGELTSAELHDIGFEQSPVLFSFDKAGLRWDALEILQKNLAVFKKHPELKIQLVGYTDSRGPDSYNRRLSVRRAKTVQNYLIKHGLPSSQVILVQGKGAQDFLNDCGKGHRCPESSHRLNRRVIFVVSHTS